MKKKLSAEQKSYLAYSIELIIFSIVFLVLGILKMTQVIGYDEKRRLIFNYITLAGCGFGIGDFIWFCFSKRRRARNFLPDKIAILVLAFYMITYDIICLVKNPDGATTNIMLGAALIYVACVYMFQGIYHYFKPVPGYVEDIKKAIAEDEANEAKKKAELEAKKASEENKKDAE